MDRMAPSAENFAPTNLLTLRLLPKRIASSVGTQIFMLPCAALRTTIVKSEILRNEMLCKLRVRWSQLCAVLTIIVRQAQLCYEITRLSRNTCLMPATTTPSCKVILVSPISCETNNASLFVRFRSLRRLLSSLSFSPSPPPPLSLSLSFLFPLSAEYTVLVALTRRIKRTVRHCVKTGTTNHCSARFCAIAP